MGYFVITGLHNDYPYILAEHAEGYLNILHWFYFM